MEILFTKEDFEIFIQDYFDELNKFKIEVRHEYDKAINMIRVILKGDKSYLNNYRFSKDIENNYNGSIA